LFLLFGVWGCGMNEGLKMPLIWWGRFYKKIQELNSMQMLWGKTCFKLYANAAMDLAKMITCLLVIVLLIIFLWFFLVVDWRFKIGHGCRLFGFLVTWYLWFATPLLRGYHKSQEWLDFGRKGFWKENKKER
jgi:hypothetical protein